MRKTSALLAILLLLLVASTFLFHYYNQGKTPNDRCIRIPECSKSLLQYGSSLRREKRSFLIPSLWEKFFTLFLDQMMATTTTTTTTTTMNVNLNEEKSALILLYSGSKIPRDPVHGDMNVPFEAVAHYRYLSDYLEPGCVLALIPATKKVVLFIPDQSHVDLIFHGPQPDKNRIREDHKFYDVLSINQLPEWGKGFTAYYSLDEHFFRQRLEYVRDLNSDTLMKVFHKSFQQKLPLETELLLFSLNVTRYALSAALLSFPLGTASEFTIANTFMHVQKSCGCQQSSYDPIVAFDDNILIMDYDSRSRNPIPSGDGSFHSLLLDVGAQCFGYAADVTRTIPLGHDSKFFPIIKKIIDEIMVDLVVGFIRPGVTFSQVHDEYERLLGKSCREMGLLETLTPLVESSSSSVSSIFTFHSIVHSVGLVVHESTAGSGILEDMVLAVEPAFYLNDLLIPVGKSYLNYLLIDEIRKSGFRGYRMEHLVYVKSAGNIILSQNFDIQINS